MGPGSGHVRSSTRVGSVSRLDRDADSNFDDKTGVEIFVFALQVGGRFRGLNAVTVPHRVRYDSCPIGDIVRGTVGVPVDE